MAKKEINYLKELQLIQNSEINFEISCFFDGGFKYYIGDRINGFLAEGSMDTLEELLPYFLEDIFKFYPESTYVKEAKKRFFFKN